MAGDDFDRDMRAGLMAERERAKRVREKEAERKAKVKKWLSPGGQQVIRRGATAEVFTRHGDKLERESPGGEKTQVSHLLDPRLKLSDKQRSTGNCYGAFFERATGSGATEFFREYVDRSLSRSGGAAEHHLHMLRMIGVAHSALIKLPAVVYDVGRSRGLGFVGPHKPVKARDLVDSICVYGFSIQTIAVNHGWRVERMGGQKQGKTEVPVRQREKLSGALRDLLDALDDVWGEHGYSIPIEFTRLVVK